MEEIEKLMKFLSSIEGIEIKSVGSKEAMKKMFNMDDDDINLHEKIADKICSALGKEVFFELAKNHMSDEDSEIKRDWVKTMGILCHLFHKDKIMLKGRSKDGDKSSDK